MTVCILMPHVVHVIQWGKKYRSYFSRTTKQIQKRYNTSSVFLFKWHNVIFFLGWIGLKYLQTQSSRTPCLLMHHSVDYYIDLNLPPFWADRHRNEIYVCYLCTLPNANKIVLDMTESLTHLLMVCIRNTLKFYFHLKLCCCSFQFSDWYFNLGWVERMRLSCVLCRVFIICA